MSRGFVKDGDIEEVPSVEQRAWIPEGVTNYVTPEGLALLNAERDELIARRDSASGNETDLRITRNYLNAKLQLLEERIASAVVPPIGSTPDKVGFGAYATVSINGGSSRTFRIVGADEADASRGLISFFSPVARAVAGHGAGERITSGLPSGNRELEVLAVSYDPLPLTVSESKQTPKSKLASPIIPASPAPSIGRAGFGFEEHLSCSSKANTRAQDGSANPPRRDDPFEILPLVNERGVTIGKATRKECHNGTKLLHPWCICISSIRPERSICRSVLTGRISSPGNGIPPSADISASESLSRLPSGARWPRRSGLKSSSRSSWESTFSSRRATASSSMYIVP